MAYLDSYAALPYIRIDGDWVPRESNNSKIKHTIFWSDGSLWMEAHRYLAEKRVKSSTLRSNAYDLKAYADWLEENSLHWLHFPIKREDRCLERFRGFLINTSNRTSAVASRRMNAVVNFYKWIKARGLIDKQIEMWADQQITITYFDQIGFNRAMSVWTTDLRIPHRKANITSVEDGLMPLSAEDRDALLGYLKTNPSDQNTILHAMFTLGFFTGARIGSIRTLRIENLKSAVVDPTSISGLAQQDSLLLLVAAGPGTGIDTKLDVSGYLRFLKPVHEFILEYAEKNVTRLERQAKASKENKSLVFLTKDGNPYGEGSINTALSDLRKALVRDNLTQFHDLKFHQTRATCGTELARLYMAASDANAIEYVREWLMHKNVSTTWKYIKFIKKSKAARKANKEFTDQFLGPNFS